MHPDTRNKYVDARILHTYGLDTGCNGTGSRCSLSDGSNKSSTVTANSLDNNNGFTRQSLAVDVPFSRLVTKMSPNSYQHRHSSPF